MEDFVGKPLGNFVVEEMIGKGGMAAVYRGRQPSMNRDVAIKIMFPQLGDDESFVRRFRNEANLIAQLEHAHILPVFDFGDQKGLLYIVMRYLDAGSLKERIPLDGLPLREAHRLFVQIASALDYAHSKGVVHRDLKPANILIDEQGNTFLTDFGIAKMMEGDENITGTGGIVGTPTYMSPEQGQATELDHRSDIYSLGILLFEMLTGKPPFSGGNPMSVMLMHMNDHPPTPSAIKPELHDAIDLVVMRALEKNRERRYQTASAMITALDEAVAIATGMTPGTIRSIEASARAEAAVASADASTLPMGPGPHGATASANLATDVGTIPMEPVTLTPTSVTSWVQGRGAALGIWLRALTLSVVTFLILDRLAPGHLTESSLLALIPGLLLYGLLRAPTLGAISAFVLILVPLLVRAPGLGILWFVLFVISAARLHHQEMLFTLVTTGLAGVPFVGFVVPLIVPWWNRVRRSVLPMALGFGLATLFAATLGWPDAAGLLPAPDVAEAASRIVIVERPVSALDLIDPASWPTAAQILPSLQATLRVIATGIANTGGPALVVMATWALAAVASVSNRRVQSAGLRVAGVATGALLLLLAHLSFALRGPSNTALAVTAFSVVDAALLTYILTQWPLQVDPNAGNLPFTVHRLLRQALGAVFMALGVSAMARALPDASFGADFLITLAAVGVLWMLVAPLMGTLLVFLSLIVMHAPLSFTGIPADARDPQVGLIMIGLLVFYLVANLAFDRRQPRRWNPIGAGALLGAPLFSAFGLMGLIPLSLGLLETQVPAAIFAVGAHVALWLRLGFPGGVGVVVQVVGALVAVILPQRLMDTPLLKSSHPKLRRLVFALLTILIVFPAYYLFGGLRVVADLGLLSIYALNVVVTVFLVLVMGDFASVWVSTPSGDEREEEEFGYDPDTAA